ncbi:hypothetical protein WDU94_006892 [Cyamophila willieti]
MSQPKSLQGLLKQAVAKLKGSIQSIERMQSDFLPTTLNEEHDLKQVLQEFLISDFKILMKLVSGKDFSLVEIYPIDENIGDIDRNKSRETTAESKDVSREETDSSELPETVRDVNKTFTSDVDSAVGRRTSEHNFDNDMTAFRGEGGHSNEAINGEITGLSSLNDRTKNGFFQEETQSIVMHLLLIYLVEFLEIGRADVDVHRVQSETAVSSQETSVSDFQDTPSSISDFRVYNTNKKTNSRYDANLKSMRTPAWNERVESYLNTIPEGGISPRSMAESVISINDDIDHDNMSIISQTIKTKQVSTEENKENAPTNNDPHEENVQIRESPNQTKEVAGKILHGQNSDDIEIVFEEKKCPAHINRNESDSSENQTFHVDSVADDTTMSCVSHSLLKTVDQTRNNEERLIEANEGAVEEKHNPVIGQKLIIRSSLEIDLTLDSDNENEDRNETVTHDSTINIPGEKDEILHENDMHVNEIIDTVLVNGEGTNALHNTTSAANYIDKNSPNDLINDNAKTDPTMSVSSTSNKNIGKVNNVTESSATKLIRGIDTKLNSDEIEIEHQDRDTSQGDINETNDGNVTTNAETNGENTRTTTRNSVKNVIGDAFEEIQRENASNIDQANETSVEDLECNPVSNENENHTHIPEKSEQPTNRVKHAMNPKDTHTGEINPVENGDSSKDTMRADTFETVSDFKYERESLHIVDDYTLNNSQDLGSLDSQYSEEKCVLSQNGNFIDDGDGDDVKYNLEDPYDIIPSVKVETIMNDSNFDEILTFEDTQETDFPEAAKTKKINKDFKIPLPPKHNSNKIKVTNETKVRIETSDQRKKCELGITSATRGLSFNDSNNSRSDISSSSSTPVKKRLGPKSKTMFRTSSGKPGTSNGERDKLSAQIKNLTNLKPLNKPHTSAGKSKPKKRKRPQKLMDYYEKNENVNTSSQSSNHNSLMAKIKSSMNQTVNQITAEELARKAILESDSESEDDFVTPQKQQKRDPNETKENVGSTNNVANRTSKPIPDWKKDRLLTANINLSPSSKNNQSPSSSNGNQIELEVNGKRKKVNKNDDDVRSVCSSMQEKVKNPILVENLKKLLDAREVIVPAISQESSISSDEEDEDDTERNGYIESDLNDDNIKQLNTEFTMTSKKRSLIIQKRTRKFIPRTPQSSQEPVTFEDRYKDTPPLILDTDEETGEQVVVCPFFSKILKDHQKRGVKFIWDVCFSNRKKIMFDQGSGCILAHDMGLGKSLQIIALLHTLKLLDNIPITKILILSPKSLVQNWEDEIYKWTKGLQVGLTVFSWSTDKNIAVQDLHEWSSVGGIYIMGYEMFVSICKRSQSCEGEQSVDWTTFFLNPGPDVIICDEAHLLKNNTSEKYKMVSQVKTRRRIALTGTPIQNNLQELYNIVNFVQPTFMKLEKFRDQFIVPISLGQKSNATPDEKKKERERISVLHKQLEKVMDREQGSNQDVGLPPKLNYDVILYLTPIQKKLYKFFFDKLKDCINDNKRNFEVERKADLIGIHPKSLEHVNTRTRSQKKAEQKYEWPVELLGDWWDKVLTRDEKESLNEIDAGVKIVIAFQILNYAASKKEKVLIFCDSHVVLDLMEKHLEKQNGYKKNVNFFRLDGSVLPHRRGKYLKTFNDDENTDAKVFLLTHKVGGVGLNFTGANRIIIFDMLWNPAHHEQSSNRTHRLGQKKTSFIYRLITKDTLEESIYKNSVSKQSLSKRVVDKERIKSKCQETGVYNNYTYRESPNPKKDLPDPKDELLNVIIHNPDLNIVHSYREQGELFELSEEHLNEEQALQEYLFESKQFDEPGETKRKRRRKSKAAAAAESETQEFHWD